MKKIILLFSFLFLSCVLFSQWTNLNTNIDDELTGIVAFDNNLLVAGHEGLYYSSNYGNDAWTRFEIPSTSADAQIYENTKFTHCYADPDTEGNTGMVYACGINMLTNQAVIFNIQLPSLNYEIAYIGEINTALNKIAFDRDENFYCVVGDNGLMVQLTETEVNTFTLAGADDFYSVHIYNSYVQLGTDDKIVLTRLYSTGSYTTLNSIATPGIQHLDVVFDFSWPYYSVGDEYTRYTPSSGVSVYEDYAYGALNGRAILLKQNKHFVGTDHGVFLSGTDKSYLELQPGSEQYTINEFWSKPNTDSTIYACGPNGLVLKTENLGGSTLPYVSVSAISACLGVGVNIQFEGGSSTNCSWTINGEVVSNGCTNLNGVMNPVGEYEVMVTGENAFGEQTTASTTFTVVERPEINKPVLIQDTLLCKLEPLEIQIEESEPNVRYALRLEGSSDQFGSSEVGDGGTISYTTGPVDVSGNYFLRATNTLANCSRNFSDRFEITVEETRSNFVSEFINASPNESVQISEATTDAQFFNWNFQPAATPSTSNLANPIIDFSDLGATSVDLISWSEAGCYDTIQGVVGPNIYDPPLEQEDCWTLVYDGDDIYNGQFEAGQFPGHYNPQILAIEPTSTGFLASGYYYNQTFDSKWGITATLEDRLGSYLTAHNFDGTLKWIVYTEKATSSDRDLIWDITLDDAENIYISGHSKGTFYDNFGNKIDLSASSEPSFIIKLSSRGELLWYMTFNFVYPKRIQVDQENNLIFAARIGDFFSSNPIKYYYLNDELQGILNTSEYEQTPNYILGKISATGSLMWETGIYLDAANSHFIQEVEVDSSNNILVLGDFETRAYFYSVGTTTPIQLGTPIGPAGYSNRLYLTKFSSDGIYQWGVLNAIESGLKVSATVGDLAIDQEGNYYISGNNDCIVESLVHVFQNTDGSETSESVGAFYIAKINAEGVCEWIRGGAHSYYGYGHRLLVKENEVGVLATIAENDEFEATVELISTNQSTYTLTISQGNYFIPFYDFDGNLLRVLQNSESAIGLQHGAFIGLIQGPDDFYYLAQSARVYDVEPPYTNFGHPLSATNEYDALITRFTEACAIINYPIPVDIDEDGFDNLVDCDDTNPDINPGAEEIPNNGIDEDCDGADLLSSIQSLGKASVQIYPNPTDWAVYIQVDQVFSYQVRLFNAQGQVVFTRANANHIDMTDFVGGLYLLEIKDLKSSQRIVEKIIKED